MTVRANPSHATRGPGGPGVPFPLAWAAPRGGSRGPRVPVPAALPAALLLALLVALGGCASIDPAHTLDAGRPWIGTDGAQAPRLALTAAQQQQLAQRRDSLLAVPLDERAAVELAWQSSPAAQALLAEGWQAQARVTQEVATPRLVVALERVVRGDELSLGRSLGIGLVDWITLPARRAAARQQIEVQGLQLAQDLLALQLAARQQWLRAVAAAQLAQYHGQAREAAEAGAELARRLQAVGNFSRLQRAREQAVLTETQGQLARATLQARVEREALVRLLGLTPDQADRLQLPARLPDLPSQPLSAEAVARAAQGQRLDVALATARWRAAIGDEQRRWTAFVDAELTLSREREGLARARGAELAIALPTPDALGVQGQRLSAQALAAARRLEQTQLEAASSLRERYAVYRSAHELALHARDEWVPLRKTITDETLFRYNGMLVGVFELLAQARLQVAAVVTAIEAQRDYWLAQVALDGAIVGVPTGTAMPAAARAPAAAATNTH